MKINISITPNNVSRFILTTALVLCIFLFPNRGWGQSTLYHITDPGPWSMSVPDGIIEVEVTLIGGGGGGGGAHGTVTGGGGGGGGGQTTFKIPITSANRTISCVVGSGGAGGAKENNGAQGGETNFTYGTAVYRAFGGGGGGYGAGSAGSGGSAGGFQGGNGTNGEVGEAGSKWNYGGAGGKGAGLYTAGGRQTSGGDGNAACVTCYGGGGGGAYQETVTSKGRTGGRGANGFCSVYLKAATVNVTFDINIPGQIGSFLSEDRPANTTITYGEPFGHILDWQNVAGQDKYTGYTFEGWYTTPECTGSEIRFTTYSTFTSDVVLYAKWLPDSMTVSFNCNACEDWGGTEPNWYYTVKYGRSHQSQFSWDWAVPTRTGYVFMGWNTKADGTGKYYGPNALVGETSDYTLYAIWEEEGDVQSSISVCSDGVTSLCAPAGYFNYSWSPTQGLSDPTAQCPTLTASQMASNNVTYTCSYAKGRAYNSDFNLLDAGFSTSYIYAPDVEGVNNELYYGRTLSVTTCWSNVHPGLDQSCSHKSFEGDYAQGGKFLAINGGADPAGVVWEQTIAVSRNTDYLIGIYAAGFSGDAAPAALLFYVNGVKISNNVFRVTNTDWVRDSVIWNSGSNDYATIILKDTTTAQNGNDFSLDHVIFKPLTTSESHSVAVTRRSAFSAGAIASTGQSICLGESVNTIGSTTAASGGDGNISYQWYVGSTAISGATSATYTPTAYASTAGTYTFTRKAKDGTCNTTLTASTNSWTLTVKDKPFVKLDEHPGFVTCPETSLTLDVSAASSVGSSVSYRWNTGYTSNPYTVSPTSTTTYTVTATATKDGCTATDSWSLTVTVLPAFTAGAIATTGQTRCYGSGSNTAIGSTTAASGSDDNISYQWRKNGTDISGATSATYTPTESTVGTYTFTRWAKDNTCNTSWTQSTGSWTLTINAAPSVMVTKPTGCPNQSSYTLTANATGGTSPYTYQWSNGATGTASTSTIAKYGTSDCGHTYNYTVLITDNKGCTATETSSFTLNDNTVPVIGTIADQNGIASTSCKYKIPDLSAVTLAATTDNCGTPTFVSQSIAANTEYAQTSTQQSIPVTVKVKDGCGNEQTATVNVLIPSKPSVALNTISNTTICHGSSATLTATPSSSEGTVTYSWNTGSTSNPYTVSPTATTTYTVTATATKGSCTATDSKSVTVTVRPAFTAGAIATTGQTTCNRCTINAIGSTTAASGGDGSISYQWRKNGTAISGATSATYTPTESTVGTYTFTRWAKDNTCNTSWTQSTGSYVLTIQDAPTLSVTSYGSRCYNQSDGYITVNVTGGNPNYTLTWTGGSHTMTAAGSYTIGNLADGSYAVSVTDGNGYTDAIASPIVIA